MTEQIIPTCYACGTPMDLKTKGTDKFWGCPNWRECGGKTIPYGKPRQKDKPQVIRPEQPNKDQIIMEELARIVKGLGILRGEHQRLEDILKNIEAQVISKEIKGS